MADKTMVVTECTRITGIPTWIGDANICAGDDGTTGSFLFPNDGRTFIILYAHTAHDETMTFVGKNDKYGRVSADLTFDVAALKTGIVGPFSPALWNDVSGQVKFALTDKDNANKLLAVRITNSERNGV